MHPQLDTQQARSSFPTPLAVLALADAAHNGPAARQPQDRSAKALHATGVLDSMIFSAIWPTEEEVKTNQGTVVTLESILSTG